ncbi:hypothetical protein BST81_21205 [Leptolyngbya sp. 'hensonii']|uniref:radical SAM/SPASM domain-containing protein n=1 Tax=Leptolyngbya sp. 'hensonii' TaxID=1922337 RepID=UPI00094FCB17|nr:radical SAM protein [Leptolyngbya sp. 'hensonii']OLP16498.1 hypothetical protein BST81_21205 [Leptolyngbya sp. 'hensonii']
MQVLGDTDLLPLGWRVPELEGTLYIPSHGIPLHVKSLERLLKAGLEQGQEIAFKPTVPVTSQLGLSQSPVLVYYYPQAISSNSASNTVEPPQLSTVPASSSHYIEVFQQSGIAWLGQKLVSKTAWIKLFKLLALRAFSGSSASIAPQQISEAMTSSSSGLEVGDIAILSDTDLDEQEYYFADHFPTFTPKPNQVSVVIANACNLKCVMCPYHSPVITPTHTTDFFKDKSWMSWEMMERLAQECGRDQLPVKIGNIEEPLLHPKIVDFVKLCREQGAPSVHITTNGQLLTEKKAYALLEAGLTSLYVSFDAARSETYDQVRGANLQRVEDNLRYFLKLRQELGASCRVMTSFVRNKGVSQAEEFEFLDRWLQSTDGVIFYNLAEYEEGNTHFAKINQSAQEFLQQVEGRWACLNPWEEVYILPDGQVYYCCETVSKLAFEKLESMGDFNSQTLREIWQGSLFNQLRKDLLRNDLENRSSCRDCGIWMGHVVSQEDHDGKRITTNMITEIYELER